jgi:hypothetical protein
MFTDEIASGMVSPKAVSTPIRLLKMYQNFEDRRGQQVCCVTDYLSITSG